MIVLDADHIHKPMTHSTRLTPATKLAHFLRYPCSHAVLSSDTIIGMTMTMRMFCSVTLLSALEASSAFTSSFMTQPLVVFKPPGISSMTLYTTADNQDGQSSMNRRRMLTTISTTASTVLLFEPRIASAGIDPRVLQNLPVEGDTSGTATRLRQVEAIQKPLSDTQDIPFTELASGVSYREYREGKNSNEVKDGSKVAVEMTIRCKSFSTNNEPGGVKYFSTKDDTDFNEVAFTVGSGEMIPGLEEGMMGMKRNALRRIEVPSTMVFAAKKANQLPLPRTKDGKRRFESLFKTDATFLFEVLVTRVK